MSRGKQPESHYRGSFPRVSGDEPDTVFAPPQVLMFSPRERG